MLTFESPVPHVFRDYGPVGRGESRLDGFIDRQSVQDDRIMERTHKTVHLTPTNIRSSFANMSTKSFIAVKCIQKSVFFGQFKIAHISNMFKKMLASENTR